MLKLAFHNNEPVGYYRRAFIDEDRKLFCITYCNLEIDGYKEVRGTDEQFRILKDALLIEGFSECSRRAFQVLVSN